MPSQADIAARRIALFKEDILQTIEEEELDLYLALVEEIADESGRDISEIAAATARLARGEKPLEMALEAEPEFAPVVDEGMIRLFIDAGRRDGIRPADVVGAIANEAGVPGRSIGAIDIYDRFTYVDLPAQFRQQVLESMAGVTIRGRRTNIRVASPADKGSGTPAKQRKHKKSPSSYQQRIRPGGKKGRRRV
jgi:ATP-dependent RNA helicase DeaD